MKRMLLIPEDFYKNLIGNDKEKGDGTAIGLLKERLHENKNEMDPETRVMLYEHDFKRYNKLVKERAEKPINVKVNNLPDFANVVGNNPTPKIILKNKVKSTRKPYFLRKRGAKKHNVQEVDKEKEKMDEDDEEDYQSASSDHDEPKERAMKYIRENASVLGVLADGKLSRRIGGNYPIITSNVEKLVNYIIKNGKTRIRPLPIGYEEFLNRINNHPILLQLLFPQQQQIGSGTVFAFKPTLWTR